MLWGCLYGLVVITGAAPMGGEVFEISRPWRWCLLSSAPRVRRPTLPQNEQRLGPSMGLLASDARAACVDGVRDASWVAPRRRRCVSSAARRGYEQRRRTRARRATDTTISPNHNKLKLNVAAASP